MVLAASSTNTFIWSHAEYFSLLHAVFFLIFDMDDLMQICGNSIANALELTLSFIKP